MVIYYSQTGNTESVAVKLANSLKKEEVEVDVASIKRTNEKDYSTNVEEAKELVEAEIEQVLTNN